MIFVTGTNDRKIAELRRELLHVGLISQKTTLSALASHLSENPHVLAVLHIVEKRRPALENVALLVKHLYPHVMQGVLSANDGAVNFLCAEKFDFVLPRSVKSKKLCEQIVFSAISQLKIDPSEKSAGALRFRLFEKEFSMALKHLSFSETYTAVLVSLMEAYPHALKASELMHLAFLPLGHSSRTNVSHAIEAINRRFSEAGLLRNGRPLIAYEYGKGYFLRS